MVGRDVEIVALHLARHRFVILERNRLAAMLEETPVGGGRLHHAAARRKIAGEHRRGALAVKRRRQRMDDVGEMDLARPRYYRRASGR